MKIWKNERESSSFAALDSNSIVIGANDTNFIKVDETGITISGKVAFTHGEESVKTGGFFINPPNITQLIPSTVVTPIPAKLPFPPVFGIANMAKSNSLYLSYLGVSL